MGKLKVTNTDINLLQTEIETFINLADTMLEDLDNLFNIIKKRSITLQELNNHKSVLSQCHQLSFGGASCELIRQGIQTSDSLTSNAFIGEIFLQVEEMMKKGITSPTKEILQSIIITYGKNICYIEDRVTGLLEFTKNQDLSDLNEDAEETLNDLEEIVQILTDNISSGSTSQLRILKDYDYEQFSGKYVVDDDKDILNILGVESLENLNIFGDDDGDNEEGFTALDFEEA